MIDMKAACGSVDTLSTINASRLGGNMRNEVLDAVTSELEAVGLDYSVNQTGKHLKVGFKVGETAKNAIVPKTSSDWRAAKNARALVRKTLKNLGVKPGRTDEIKEPPPKVKAEHRDPYIVRLEERVAYLEGEVRALAEILLEKPIAPPPPIDTRPFNIIRPSELRKFIRLATQAQAPHPIGNDVIDRQVAELRKIICK
jgi:hypothetical protein